MSSLFGNRGMKRILPTGRLAEPPENGPVAELLHRLGAVPASADSKQLAAKLAHLAREAVRVPDSGRSRTGGPLSANWRRRAMLTTFLSSLAGKLMIATAALAATTGGLAVTGNLPDPAQEWAAEVFSRVGIEIPAPAVEGEAGDVLDAVFEGDPKDGAEYGKGVADAASEGRVQEGLDRAEAGAENADAVSEGGMQEGLDRAEAGAENARRGVPRSAEGAVPDTTDPTEDSADARSEAPAPPSSGESSPQAPHRGSRP